MKTVTVAVGALLLASAWQLPADTAIGTISLLPGSVQNGYQEVAVTNLTGASQGCAAVDPAYGVCNQVTIQNWRMEIDFTAEVSGLAPSPLVFTSAGSQDDITPDLGSYTGEANDSWTLPLDVTNANCSPVCDAIVSEVIFSGTLDTTSLYVYNGNPLGPYTLDTLNSANFTADWVVPVAEAYASPGEVFAQTDIDIDVTQTPEPASFLLLLAAGVTLGLIKRVGLLSIGR